MNYKAYVDFVCELLNIDVPKVVIKNKDGAYDLDGNECEDVKLNKSAMATTFYSYDFGRGRIVLDEDKLGDMIIVAIPHELRHMYQRKMAYSNEKSKLYRQWRLEICNYADSRYHGYQNQRIELDANAFASIIVKNLFGKEFKVECNRARYMDALWTVEMEFPTDFIMRVYERYKGTI